MSRATVSIARRSEDGNGSGGGVTSFGRSLVRHDPERDHVDVPRRPVDHAQEIERRTAEDDDDSVRVASREQQLAHPAQGLFDAVGTEPVHFDALIARSEFYNRFTVKLL
jgi:hypothetical protein